MKTINLKLPRARWYDVSPPVAATIVIFCLLAIGLLIGRVRSAPSAVALPTPALDPIIIVASPRMEPPRPTPVPPTPDQQVYQELEALRARIAELEAQQADAPQPEVVYQPIYIASQPAEAAPTVSEPLPTMAPQQWAILDRNQWAADAQRAGR